MNASAITSVFNDGVIAEQFERYRHDPSSVDETWRQYFAMAEALFAGNTGSNGTRESSSASPATSSAGGYDLSMLQKVAGAASLLQAIRNYGHLAVQLDPLGTPPPGADELTNEHHGVSDEDLYARVHQEVARYLQSAEAKDMFLRAGIDPVPTSPDELVAIMNAEMARMGKVLRAAGMGVK